MRQASVPTESLGDGTGLLLSCSTDSIGAPGASIIEWVLSLYIYMHLKRFLFCISKKFKEHSVSLYCTYVQGPHDFLHFFINHFYLFSKFWGPLSVGAPWNCPDFSPLYGAPAYVNTTAHRLARMSPDGLLGCVSLFRSEASRTLH